MARVEFRGPRPGRVDQVGVEFTRLTAEEAQVAITFEDQEHALVGTPQQMYDLAIGILDGLDPRHHRLGPGAPPRPPRAQS